MSPESNISEVCKELPAVRHLKYEFFPKTIPGLAIKLFFYEPIAPYVADLSGGTSPCFRVEKIPNDLSPDSYHYFVLPPLGEKSLGVKHLASLPGGGNNYILRIDPVEQKLKTKVIKATTHRGFKNFWFFLEQKWGRLYCGQEFVSKDLLLIPFFTPAALIFGSGVILTNQSVIENKFYTNLFKVFNIDFW